MGKSDKPELHRYASTGLMFLILLNVILSIGCFYLSSSIDSFIKLFTNIDEASQNRSAIEAILIVVGILGIGKIIGSVLMLLRKKLGFWITYGAALGSLITYSVLGFKAGFSGFAMFLIFTTLIIYIALLVTLLLRVNGESGWKQLK